MSTQDHPASQQQQTLPRKPPFADWPTIKILTPPQGQYSLNTDEWCFTYSSQSVSGRIHGKEPTCRSICVRKVFPHEVRNIIAFKKHKKLDVTGKATYPLPVEGQSANLPRILGGKAPEDPEDPNPSRSKEPSKNWDEGWYLWTGKGRVAAHEKLDSMSLDLERQQRQRAFKERRREVWQDYQDSLRQKNTSGNAAQNEEDVRQWVPNVPLRPLPDTSSNSLLVPLPPDFPPFWDRIGTLLAPSFRVLDLLQDSFKSGQQKEFAQRLWDKAWTKEPYMLASRTFTQNYKRWKEKDETTDEEDDKKNSP